MHIWVTLISRSIDTILIIDVLNLKWKIPIMVINKILITWSKLVYNNFLLYDNY